MNHSARMMLAAALALGFVTSAPAETASHEHSVYLPLDKLVFTPAHEPRDGQDRRDLARGRNATKLALKLEKCGDLPEEDRPACVRRATEEHDRSGYGRRAAPNAAAR